MATMHFYEIRIGSESAVQRLKPANILSISIFRTCLHDVSERRVIPHIWLKAVGAT